MKSTKELRDHATKLVRTVDGDIANDSVANAALLVAATLVSCTADLCDRLDALTIAIAAIQPQFPISISTGCRICGRSAGESHAGSCGLEGTIG